MINLKYIKIQWAATLLILAIVAFSCSSPQKENQNENQAETVNADPRNIHLSDLEGNEMSISDFKGKVVFLNFWATWCKPCIAEMPSIERAIQKLTNKDIVFLLASDESVEKIEKFIDKKGFDLPFVRMLDDYEALQIPALPTTIVFDRNGEVVINEAGAREWDADDMIEKLSQL